MIDLFRPAMSATTVPDLTLVLSSGYIGQGNQVEWFETALKETIDYPYMVTTNSATSALTLALHMLKLPPTIEVLTTPLTCMATSSTILANRLVPVWCDIDPRTLNICLQDARSKLSSMTRVLMLVHWGGYPIDMEEVDSIKSYYFKTFGKELYVVEDCAHAWLSKFKGKNLGTFGNYAAYSFGPIKPLTCGDGGLLTLPNEETMKRAKLLRWYGIDRDDRECDINEFGFKYHMNDISATIGLSNVEMSKHNVKLHKRNSNLYDHQLKNVPGFKILQRDPDFDSSCWLYTALVEKRGGFMKKMIENGIEARPVHKRNDYYRCMNHLRKPTPRLDSIYQNIVCIPVGWWLTIDDRNHIINTIRSGW